MTAVRTRGSQRIRNNCNTDLERLEGVTALVEDWHAKQCLLGVRVLVLRIVRASTKSYEHALISSLCNDSRHILE